MLEINLLMESKLLKTISGLWKGRPPESSLYTLIDEISSHILFQSGGEKNKLAGARRREINGN